MKALQINHKHLFYITNSICNIYQFTSDNQFHQSIQKHGYKIIYRGINTSKLS